MGHNSRGVAALAVCGANLWQFITQFFQAVLPQIRFIIGDRKIRDNVGVAVAAVVDLWKCCKMAKMC